MSFQIKDFRSIVASSINHLKGTQTQLTDFNVGSVIRSMIEAPAIELDEFYQQVFRGLLDAIPVAVYKAFGFDPLPPAAASGFVRFRRDHSVLGTIDIPLGTMVGRSDTATVYETVEAGAIAANALFADVRVAATTTGSAGNASALALVRMVGGIAGVDSVSNPSAVMGGRDGETESERKARFIGYVSNLSRGTAWAVRYAASTAVVKNAAGDVIEYVTRVGMEEGAGHAEVYVYGSGGEPSEALLKVAQGIIDGGYKEATGQWIPGYRGAGIEVSVLGMSKVPVDISLNVRMLAGFAQNEAAIREVLDRLLLSVDAGDTLLVDQIQAAILTVSGVAKSVCANESNIICPARGVITVGNLYLNWF